MAEGRETIIDPGNITTREFISAWHKGDKLANEIMETARMNLTAAISFLMSTLAPDVVVLGGGLTTDPEWFIKPVQERIGDFTAIPPLRNVPIRKATLGDNVVLYGAAGIFTKCAERTTCRKKLIHA